MPVKNMRSRNIEPMDYITPDGVRYRLHNPPKRNVVATDGWGMFPISVETTNGPFQHGVDALSYRANTRIITVTLRFNDCSRAEFRNRQRELNNILRISRTDLDNPVMGTLIWYTADGRQYAADCQATEGPTYPSRGNEWDQFSIQDTIEFTAFNPILYDPRLKTLVVSDFSPIITPNTELSFPISFPISFGVPPQQQVSKNINVNYLGDFLEYPQIVLTGPGSNPKITNTSTGIYTELAYDMIAGEIVTFDLSYGVKSITSSINDDLGGYVTDGSKTALFSLQPDPIVANGLNILQFTVDHADVATSCTVNYYDRYTGV